jgi:hypothetical protein
VLVPGAEIKRMSVRQKSIPLIRIALLVTSLSLIAAFVADEYGLVRATVRFICINCLGLGG